MVEYLIVDERGFEIFTDDGIKRVSGHNLHEVPLFGAIELATNAIDAARADNEPVVKLIVDFSDQLVKYSFSNNGKSIKWEELYPLFDPTKLASTKRFREMQTCGKIGSALKIIAAYPYAVLRAEKGLEDYFIVRSEDWKTTIMYEVDFSQRHANLLPPIKRKRIDGEKLTVIEVVLPLLKSETLDYERMLFEKLLELVILNPDVEFYVKFTKNEEVIYEKSFQRVSIKRESARLSSVLMISPAEFQELIQLAALTEGRVKILKFLRDQFVDCADLQTFQQKLEEVGIDGDATLAEISLSISNVSAIYDALRENTPIKTEELPSLLRIIGENAFIKRIEDFYGEKLPRKNFRYSLKEGVKPFTEQYRGRTYTVYRPYVIEAITCYFGKVLADEVCKVVVGVNNASSFRNPLSNVDLYREKGNRRFVYKNVYDLLRSYGIDAYAQDRREKAHETVGIVVNIGCPNLDILSYDKSQLDINPLSEEVSEVIKDVCGFYENRLKALNLRLVGGRSPARQKSLELLKERAEIFLKNNYTMPREYYTSLQGHYYTVRRELGGNVVIKRESLTKTVDADCRRLSSIVLGYEDELFREKLGIIAGERALFYFRGEVRSVRWEDVPQLAQYGCDILVIEKEAMAELLASLANEFGVAILCTRGFAVKYANFLVRLAKNMGGNLFKLFDWDASGMLASLKIAYGKDLGVDEQMLASLGVNLEDVEEIYAPLDNHLKALKDELVAYYIENFYSCSEESAEKLAEAKMKYIRRKRVEIDSVLSVVGLTRLWDYLKDRMESLAKKRDLTRSLQLEVPTPREIDEVINEIKAVINEEGRKILEEIVREKSLKEWRNGLVQIKSLEEEIRSEVENRLKKLPKVQEIIRKVLLLRENLRSILN